MTTDPPAKDGRFTQRGGGWQKNKRRTSWGNCRDCKQPITTANTRSVESKYSGPNNELRKTRRCGTCYLKYKQTRRDKEAKL